MIISHSTLEKLQKFEFLFQNGQIDFQKLNFTRKQGGDNTLSYIADR